MMRVLFAYDGSPYAKRALHYGARFGGDVSALVISVSPVLIEAPHTEQSVDPQHPSEEVQRQLEEARELLAADGVQAETIHAFGNPPAEIIHAAERTDADLIVMGQRGRSAISRFIDGSVSDRVVRHATCDVLVVR
jgi:nucleotide-binding universal stress UspA family protein